MVQNSERRPRGRPRGYDPEKALGQAMGAFWDAGYAGTSLDDISSATGMNRPSLYAAFGDKQAIYLKAIERYRAGPALRDALAAESTLREALDRSFKAALAVYLSGDQGQRGCFVIGTAAVEAVNNPIVRKELAGVLREVDEAFEERIRRAQAEGEVSRDADPAMLARTASAILHSLAVRARSGEKRRSLEALAETGVRMICG
jgi:TetR/AcrR family transcriptional regulator, copper-responsive repressor